MDINEFFANLSGQSFINIFFKAFGILFAFIYLIYAIVISKQTQVMNETLKGSSSGFFTLISTLQIFVGVGLVLLAIFFI